MPEHVAMGRTAWSLRHVKNRAKDPRLTNQPLGPISPKWQMTDRIPFETDRCDSKGRFKGIVRAA